LLELHERRKAEIDVLNAAISENYAEIECARRGRQFGDPGEQMKSAEQIQGEICAAMADAWLAACERRVITPSLDVRLSIVIDTQERRQLFGPATGDECRLFVHRMAARDALLAVGSLLPSPVLS
jgi:hypothetical protein